MEEIGETATPAEMMYKARQNGAKRCKQINLYEFQLSKNFEYPDRVHFLHLSNITESSKQN